MGAYNFIFHKETTMKLCETSVKDVSFTVFCSEAADCGDVKA